ncbi:MAG: hypothetical protein GXP24_11190 [Planctomycetes bacterium]|nr:hypothetical protein [Planctomycetota bacterium]
MSEQEEDLTSDEAASLAQQEMLENCLELVFDAYDEGVDDKVVDPIVFLLDCEDEIGEEIASAWLGAEVVSDAVAEQQSAEPGSDLTTVFARAFPLAESRQEVPGVFPYLASVFESELPKDGFLAIAVTAGGASAFTVPLTARDLGNS